MTAPKKRKLPPGVYAVGRCYRVMYSVRGRKFWTAALFALPQQAAAWRGLALTALASNAPLPPLPSRDELLADAGMPDQTAPKLRGMLDRTIAEQTRIWIEERRVDRISFDRVEQYRSLVRRYIEQPYKVAGTSYPAIGSYLMGRPARLEIEKFIRWVVTENKDPSLSMAGPDPHGRRTNDFGRFLIWLLCQVHIDAQDDAPDGQLSNPFVGIYVPPTPEGVRVPHADRAFDLRTTKRIAAGMHRADRAAVWLQSLASTRISEAHGLQLASFNPVQGLLHVRRQGGEYRRSGPGQTKATETTESVKTEAAYRWLPIPTALVEFLLGYIEEFHGLTIEDFTDNVFGGTWEEFDGRRLVVGAGGGLPRNKHFNTALAHSFDLIRDVDEEIHRLLVLGMKARSHHLRKTVASYLDSKLDEVPGRAVSRYLGHKVQGANDQRSAVTWESYTKSTRTGLLRLREVLDDWVDDELAGTLDVSVGDLDELGLADALDLISTADVCALAEVHRTAVYNWCKQGYLTAVRNPTVVAPALKWFHRSQVEEFLSRRMTDGVQPPRLRPDGVPPGWIPMPEARAIAGVSRTTAKRRAVSGDWTAKKFDQGLRQAWFVDPDSIDRRRTTD